MYETINQIQKIVQECKLSEVNEKVVQLKQITNWSNFNNSLLFDKNTWQKVNADMKHSLEIGISYNFKWAFDNITQNISDSLLVMCQNMPDYSKLFNANFKEIIKSYSEIISRYELNQDFINSWKNLQELLNKIGKLLLDELFSEINYTKEDLATEIEEFSVDLQNQLQYIDDDSIDPKVQMEEYLSDFRIKHPVLYQVFLVISVTISLMGSVDTISNITPKIEDTIVYLQGNSDTYYIKEEKVKIYEGASSQTKVKDFIFYGEKVIKLEDAKLWVKVLCKGKSGNLVIGWIAKRNLMSYKDYQFNSDKLYNID